MVEDPEPSHDGDAKEPNLELPSFRLRRRKKDRSPAVETATPSTELTDRSSPEEESRTVSVTPPSAPPAPAEAAAKPAPRDKDQGKDRATKNDRPKNDGPKNDRPKNDGSSAKAKTETKTKAETKTEAKTKTQPEAEPETKPGPATPEVSANPPAPTASTPRLPALGPVPAALLTGALVGLLAVMLTFGSARGCEAVRGVGSCGGFGIFALIAIAAAGVLLGMVLLRCFDLPEPFSTSFLAVGLASVFTMLFLLGRLDSIWAAVLLPALGALSYAVSWRITATSAEPAAPAAERSTRPADLDHTDA